MPAFAARVRPRAHSRTIPLRWPAAPENRAEDRLSRVNARIKEYLDFCVPVVWLVDPEEKKVWIYRQTGMEEASGNAVRVDGTELELPLAEIFD